MTKSCVLARGLVGVLILGTLLGCESREELIGRSSEPLVTCVDTSLESVTQWLTADGWLGPKVAPKVTGNAVVFTTEVAPGRFARIERVFHCGDANAWGPEEDTVFNTNAQSVSVNISTSSAVPVRFRLWDKRGGFYEWPLGMVNGAASFNLSIPTTGQLDRTRLGGFGFQLDDGRTISSVTPAASGKLVTLTLSGLSFSATAVAGGRAPLSPSLASVTLGSVKRPEVPAAISGSPVHLVLMADAVSALINLHSDCAKDQLEAAIDARNKKESFTPNADCTNGDVALGTALARLLRSRACPAGQGCVAELSFGPDNVKAEYSPDDWTLAWPLIKARLDGVTSSMNDAGIPFYLQIAGPSAFSVADPSSELGTSYCSSASCRGFWIGENGVEQNTTQFTRVLAFAKAAGKVVVHHRMTNGFWQMGLWPEFMALIRSSSVDYSGVYVPAWEMVEPASSSLNMATVQGFWVGGWSKAMGVSTQSWAWENMRWGGTDDMRAQDWLRMMTVGVATGASYVQVEPTSVFGSSCALSSDTQLVGTTLPPCGDSSRVAANAAALTTFHGWVRDNVVQAADGYENLLSLNERDLQTVDSPVWHQDIDSTTLPNLRPASGCFTAQELSKLRADVVTAVPTACKPSTCDAAACVVALGQGDHVPFLVNIPGRSHVDRSRTLPTEDIFGRLYGNSEAYQGLMPQLPFGMLPILPMVGSWNQRPKVCFTGAVTRDCDTGVSSTSVRGSSDSILEQASNGSSAGFSIFISGNRGTVFNGSGTTAFQEGGGSIIRASDERYVAYLWDTEQRFPLGASVTIRVKDSNAFDFYDAVTGERLRNWAPTPNSTVAATTVSIPPAGVRIFNVVKARPRGKKDAVVLTGVADNSLGRVSPEGTAAVSLLSAPSFGGWSKDTSIRALAGEFDGDTNALSDVILVGGGWQAMPTARSRTTADGFDITNFSSFAFQTYAAVGNVEPLIGDYDGDKRSDVALSGGAGWEAMPVAFTRAGADYRVTNQYFKPFQTYSASSGVTRLVGNFVNNANRSSIALVGGGNLKTIPVAVSAGDGNFTLKDFEHKTDWGVWASAANVRAVKGRFNSDVYDDIALTGGASWNNVPVALANGDGTFSIRNTYAPAYQNVAGETGSRILSGDFDGDGVTDLLACGATNYAVAFGTATGDSLRTARFAFGAPGALPSSLGGTNDWIVAGDFDGDGRTDLFFAKRGVAGSAGVAYSRGDGTFEISEKADSDLPLKLPLARAVLVGRF